MRTVILGLDAFDPFIFERLHEQGRVPNLSRFVEEGAYARFEVADPPQSEVSWTSIATGLNPGSHGIFDFVHRDPATYTPIVSLLPTKEGLTGTQFVPPSTARTIFDQAAAKGYRATSLWWPATFPARPQSPVRTIPGLGTPDILGRLGVGTFFTTDPDRVGDEGKIPVRLLSSDGKDRYRGHLEGPVRKKLRGTESTVRVLEVERTSDDRATISLEDQRVELKVGEWSPILELSFKMGLFFSVRALTQVIVTQLDPEIALYVLPLQIHPLKSPWRYGTPGSFVKESWKMRGPFLTLGWPQDTTALEEGYVDETHFLALCKSIVDRREQVFMYHLDRFEEGVLGAVFDTLDRVQHMFLRQRPDVVEEWYVRLDQLVGRVEQRLAARGMSNETRLLILSDHGFSTFDNKVHLNRWLIKQGYLATKENEESGTLKTVDWSRTRAYALGLNSVYVNLRGREGKGIVNEQEKAELVNELCNELQRWRGPDGEMVVVQALTQQEAFDGPLSGHGPDVVVGYAPGYRASQQTGLGKWEANAVEENRDRWRADHCMAAPSVSGVIFATHDLLRDFPHPSYRDVPALAIDALPDASGASPPPGGVKPEDEKLIEERLKGLGYL